MDLLADLDARGLVQESTDRAALAARLAAGPLTLYYGCDPSANSLHHGNLIGLVMLRRFQDAGHVAVALAGGATGMIGDPSGRSDERNLLDDETLDGNVAAIKAQIERIVDLSDGRGRLVDNRDWTAPITVLEFLREVGKHATVNQMLARESVHAPRVRAGDLVHRVQLHAAAGQRLPLAARPPRVRAAGRGVRPVGQHRVRGRPHPAHAPGRRARLGLALLTGADGSKLGKTSGARVWLDPQKTSPYRFHQHWMQLDDGELEPQFLVFSLRSREEIAAILADHAVAPERRRGQRALADEVTALVHGADAARAAGEAADVLFGADPLAASPAALDALAAEVPFVQVSSLDETEDVLLAAGVAGSKGELRRLLVQGGVQANGRRLVPGDGFGDVPLLHGRWLLLRKGKRSYHLVEVFSQPG